MEKTVVELFAGVGGFRVGLNNIKGFYDNGRAIEDGNFDFVWANQWEPSTKKVQYAYSCYKLRFGDNEISNQDISKVIKENIPDHTLLCGGFPCQDYSVARSISDEKGIKGKKGVLWWQIVDILKAKQTPFIFLENVDRLLKSPAKQRGRDFGIMLRCLNDLEYTVEWRVINAAEYGFPQKRRRIYIFAYKNTTKFAKKMSKLKVQTVLHKNGIFAQTFKIKNKYGKLDSFSIKDDDICKDLVSITERFSHDFQNTGYMSNGIVYTQKTYPIESENKTLLRDIIQINVDEDLYLDDKKIAKFRSLRGPKKVNRINKDGFKYVYAEGKMSDYDELTKPGRTMLTSEGTVNRSTHIIMSPDKNKLRLLTPIECERLNQFPDNWTNSGMPIKRRYFMMGNALVCGIVSRLGKTIEKIIDNE